MTHNEIELAQNLRRGLIGVLELWTSKEEQLDYQTNVPIANVCAELFCQWDDYYIEESPIMLKAFSQLELEVFAEFNTILCKISDALPAELPSLKEFHTTTEWQIINQAAISSLTNLGLEHLTSQTSVSKS